MGMRVATSTGRPFLRSGRGGRLMNRFWQKPTMPTRHIHHPVRPGSTEKSMNRRWKASA